METLERLGALLEELEDAHTRALDKMEAKVNSYDSGRATAYFHATVMVQSVRRAIAADLTNPQE